MKSNTSLERSRQLTKLFGISVVMLVLCGLATAQIFSQCNYVPKDPVTEPCNVATGCTDTCQRTYYDEAVCEVNPLSSCLKEIQSQYDTVKTYGCVPGTTCHCPSNVPAMNTSYVLVDRERCTS